MVKLFKTKNSFSRAIFKKVRKIDAIGEHVLH